MIMTEKALVKPFLFHFDQLVYAFALFYNICLFKKFLYDNMYPI